MQLRTHGLTWQTVGEDLVVLDLGTSRYLQVNATGRALWDTLATGASTSELVEMLMERFGIERPRAAADVDAFVADLRTRGLIEE